MYVIFENFLSEDECDHLVMLYQQGQSVSGLVVHNKGTFISDEDVLK